MAVDNGLWIEGQLHDEHRFCGYERRNTGRSEVLPGAQTPEEIVADIVGLADAVGEEGPFILLGASFGGMVAHAFAVTHPDQVAGIVLLDALFPDELELDRYLDPEWTACSAMNQRLDERRSLEKINQCTLYRYCVAREDREPEVPLTYLASRQEPWARSERSTPEYARRITDTQRSYVDRWSPGRFVLVDSPASWSRRSPSGSRARSPRCPSRSSRTRVAARSGVRNQSEDMRVTSVEILLGRAPACFARHSHSCSPAWPVAVSPAPADASPVVERAQRRLNQLGCQSGPVDGGWASGPARQSSASSHGTGSR